MDRHVVFLLLLTVGRLEAEKFTWSPLLPGQAVTVIATVHERDSVGFKSCNSTECYVMWVDGRTQDKQRLTYKVNWSCDSAGYNCHFFKYRRDGGVRFSDEEVVFHVERDAENLIVWEEGKPEGKAWISTVTNCTGFRVGDGIPVEISGLFGAHGPRSHRNFSDKEAPFTDARLRDMVADVLQGLLPSLRVTTLASALKTTDAPDPVKGLKADANSSTAMLVSWRPPQQVRGEIEYFEVRAVRLDQADGTANATERPLFFFETVDKQQQSYEKLITGLLPKTVYNVEVRCRDSVGLNEPAFLNVTLPDTQG